MDRDYEGLFKIVFKIIRVDGYCIGETGDTVIYGTESGIELTDTARAFLYVRAGAEDVTEMSESEFWENGGNMTAYIEASEHGITDVSIDMDYCDKNNNNATTYAYFSIKEGTLQFQKEELGIIFDNLTQALKAQGRSLKEELEEANNEHSLE